MYIAAFDHLASAVGAGTERRRRTGPALPEPRQPVDGVVRALEHQPEAADAARRIARTVLKHWGLGEDEREAVVLVVSELVTNAVEHAQPPVVLDLHREDHQRCVWIGISDGGPAAEEGDWTASCASDEHGRGMSIVDAVALTHGVRYNADGTTHWARLPAS